MKKYKVGDTVEFDGKIFRIILMNMTYVWLIELGINRYHIEVVSSDYLSASDMVTFVEDTYGAAHMTLPDRYEKNVREKAAAINAILEGIYPDYDKLGSKATVDGLKEYALQFGCSVKTAHKDIRKYLQSGKDPYALVDGRTVRHYSKSRFVGFSDKTYKRGTPLKDGTRRFVDPKQEKKHFNEAFDDFKTGKVTSVQAAYEAMLDAHYSTSKGDGTYEHFSEKDIPSPKRFRAFCSDKMNGMVVKAYKKGVRKRRNDDRIQFGNARTGCPYPGCIVEVDACELIIVIVSEDRRQDLGKPVVYFAVDVFSSAILGYYIGFENNSFLGATSLFANLFFDGKGLSDHEGIPIVPTGVIPDSIREDHGSEWVSEDIRRFSREIELDDKIVPPGMGSLKGLVESSFRSYQENLRAAGKPYGVLYKEYESRHYENACMILEELKADVWDFIVAYNQRILKNYTLSKEMVELDIPPVPYKLWDYGINYCAGHRNVTQALVPDLLFALCKPCVKNMRVSISMKGFKIHDLYYINRQPKIINLIENHHYHRTLPEFEVRYDPRSVAEIYVRVENEIIAVPLAPGNEEQMSYKDLTWFQYDLLWNDARKTRDEYSKQADTARTTARINSGERMQKAKKEQAALGGKNNKKNIRESRSVRRDRERFSTALGIQTGVTSQRLLPDSGIPEGVPSGESGQDVNDETDVFRSDNMEDYYD